MLRTRPWIIGSFLVLVLVLALVLASCGGSTTTTTATPVTTAQPTTTNAPTTTLAPTTTIAPTTAEAQTTTTAAQTTTTAAPTTTTVAIDPAALYAQDCAGCHSRVPSASLATATKVITSGRESMPAFKNKLTPDQLAALAAWVANGGK